MAGGYCYCLVAGLVACTPDRGQVNVIPLPNDMEIKEGFFEIDSTRFVNEGADKFITCHIDSASYNELGDEGYELSVSSGAVHLNAATGKGAFYALLKRERTNISRNEVKPKCPVQRFFLKSRLTSLI